MQRYVYSTGAVMLLAACMPAMAFQASGNLLDNPDIILGKGYFAGGYTVATGDAANFVDNGWNLGFGGQWQLGTGPVWLRLDFEYSRNEANHQLLNEGSAVNQTRIDHGWSDLWSNDLDAIYYMPLSPRVRAYFMGGAGGAIRRISLTQTVATVVPLVSTGRACARTAAIRATCWCDSRRPEVARGTRDSATPLRSCTSRPACTFMLSRAFYRMKE